MSLHSQKNTKNQDTTSIFSICEPNNVSDIPTSICMILWLSQHHSHEEIILGMHYLSILYVQSI